jgi:hypothetical protein
LFNFKFYFILYKYKMTQTNSKLAGGITAILVIALILFISMQANEKNLFQFPENVSNFIGSSPLVAVEAFGDHEDSPSGHYWNGAANNYQPVRSAGPPIGGTQSASYQMYQQAVNAATPSMTQLDNISNQPGGGFGNPNYTDGIGPPAGQGTMYDAAAVNYGNRRAEMISPCAQNAPTFVASSLLPKTNLPGVPSWDVTDTKALAHQDFLSPAQQFGTDTISSSLRNASYDIRDVIPNSVQVVSPWMNSTITPELQRRPLSCGEPQTGTYGCNVPSGASLGGFK